MQTKFAKFSYELFLRNCSLHRDTFSRTFEIWFSKIFS